MQAPEIVDTQSLVPSLWAGDRLLPPQPPLAKGGEFKALAFFIASERSKELPIGR